MDTLQNELQSTYPVLRIQLLGVNEKGQEAGNAGVVAGRDLPWLQDVDADGNGIGDVTGDRWAVTNRDLVILDGSNAKVGVFNLNPPNNLADATAYSTLREMLIDAAMQSQKPWRNPANPLDVDGNGRVVPLDVLLIVNLLNSAGPHKLPPPTAAQPAPPYYDVNGDGLIAPLDALNVINFLNTQVPTGGEGESPITAPTPASAPVSLSHSEGFASDTARLVAVDRLFAGSAIGPSSPAHFAAITDSDDSQDTLKSKDTRKRELQRRAVLADPLDPLVALNLHL